MFMNHDVGLYTATGTLVATTTVTPTDTLDGIFRYHSILPVNLAAGDYVLVGVAGYDPGILWISTHMIPIAFPLILGLLSLKTE